MRLSQPAHLQSKFEQKVRTLFIRRFFWNFMLRITEVEGFLYNWEVFEGFLRSYSGIINHRGTDSAKIFHFDDREPNRNWKFSSGRTKTEPKPKNRNGFGLLKNRNRAETEKPKIFRHAEKPKTESKLILFCVLKMLIMNNQQLLRAFLTYFKRIMKSHLRLLLWRVISLNFCKRRIDSFEQDW